MNSSFEQENLWGYRKRLHFVLGALGDAFSSRSLNEMSVLDVGCGNGSQLAIPLAQAGIKVTGIDTDETSIAHARKLAFAVPNARFECGSVESFPDKSFDAVVLSEVLEHVAAPQKLLRSAVDRLAMNGIVIVTTPNGYGEFEWDSWLFRLLRMQKVVSAVSRNGNSALAGTDNDSSGHIQFFTQRRLLKLFSECGLRIWRQQAATLLAGPFVGHTFARSQRFIDWNARAADTLPMAVASGWYFALRRADVGAPS